MANLYLSPTSLAMMSTFQQRETGPDKLAPSVMTVRRVWDYRASAGEEFPSLEVDPADAGHAMGSSLPSRP